MVSYLYGRYPKRPILLDVERCKEQGISTVPGTIYNIVDFPHPPLRGDYIVMQDDCTWEDVMQRYFVESMVAYDNFTVTKQNRVQFEKRLDPYYEAKPKETKVKLRYRSTVETFKRMIK